MKRRFGEDVFKKVDKEGGKMVGFTVEGGVKKEAFLDREACFSFIYLSYLVPKYKATEIRYLMNASQSTE